MSKKFKSTKYQIAWHNSVTHKIINHISRQARCKASVFVLKKHIEKKGAE